MAAGVVTGSGDVTINLLETGQIAQPAQDPLWMTEGDMTCFVYVFGDSTDSSTVKIGKAVHGTNPLTTRRRSIETAQMAPARLVLLAAVQGTPQNERAVKEYFAEFRVHGPGTNNTETFFAVPEIIEWANWLRQQYSTWTSEDDGPDDLPSFPSWCPNATRRVPLDEPNPDQLVQDWDTSNGQLSNTPWAPMARPLPPHNDYYTPVEIVNTAREAMGGIDLDPATHWTAARAHGITNYYHQYKSAFDNPWAGRIWINPPYGENSRWFTEIIRYWDRGDITQLCMLSPVWAFNTHIARPVIDRSSAMLVLSPTPKFWGRHKNGRVVEAGAEELGVNHPHAILYMGDRVREFKEAFAKYGIPMQLDLSDHLGDGTT